MIKVIFSSTIVLNMIGCLSLPTAQDILSMCIQLEIH